MAPEREGPGTQSSPADRQTSVVTERTQMEIDRLIDAFDKLRVPMFGLIAEFKRLKTFTGLVAIGLVVFIVCSSTIAIYILNTHTDHQIDASVLLLQRNQEKILNRCVEKLQLESPEVPPPVLLNK